MALQRSQQRTRLAIPNAHALIVTGRDDAFAIRAVRRGPDNVPVALSVRSSAPVSPSQMRTLPSSLAETMRLPSGLYAADLTPAVWPSSVASSAPVSPSQMRTL
ncbi:hypothetical protein [Candidatus Amarolinea dominans]|uniref:hypothetical protein n=1 Tax=Candidatus Amarolinea dominans TaxID=3140696 RepID=UPI0031CC655D